MTKQQPLRGVNLGGWLVLEKWITPQLFKGVEARDEHGFMQTKGAARKINRHRKTFITEADFAWLAENGVNAVRIPIGYWALEGDAPYTSTVTYLDWAFDMAETYGLKVLLSLHGVKGSQNGHDHSGQLHRRDWHRKPDYRQQTIDTLEQLATRYYRRECLWGITLVNEPKSGFMQLKLRRFYRQAQRRLLEVLRPDVHVVVSDAFTPWLMSGVLTSQPNYPVAMDVHWYQFGYTRSWKRCLAMIRRRSKTIQRWQRRQPVVVGEWSGMLSTALLARIPAAQRRQYTRKHIQAQLDAYQPAAGWFYWTYKTDGSGPWNFRAMVEDGSITLN